jgi:hypothetical protein
MQQGMTERLKMEGDMLFVIKNNSDSGHFSDKQMI